MTITIFLGALLGAMALGVPIAFSLLACGVALMWHLQMFDPQILAQNTIEGANSFPLLAVPFFMLAGEIMNAGGLSRRIVQFAMTLVGHVRGGLGYVGIMAAMGGFKGDEEVKFTMISGPISQALIVTAAGILVAVEAVILFNYFSQHANRIAMEMKLQTDEFLELLLEQPGDSQPARGKKLDSDTDDKDSKSKARAKGDGDGDREAA